jgi:hypothetical protein
VVLLARVKRSHREAGDRLLECVALPHLTGEHGRTARARATARAPGRTSRRISLAANARSIIACSAC